MTTHDIETGKLGDHRALTVWAALVVATVASYLLSAEHAIESPDVVAAVVLGVTFIKVRLVALHFMELSRAPALLRLIIEAYCLVTPLVLIALYFVA